MLPETEFAKAEYVTLRDARNRWRKDFLKHSNGDADGFKAYLMDWLSQESEVASLREIVDFLQDEEILTPEMTEAAQNAVAWGVILRDLATAAKAGRAA